MRSTRLWANVTLTLAVACSLIAGPRSLGAQDKPAANASQPEKAKPGEATSREKDRDARSSSVGNSGGSPSEPPLAAWEKLIYVPFKQLKSVLDNESATVFMPYSQFLKLWQGGAVRPRDPNRPPVNAVITSATYVGKVEKDLVKIDADFTIRVLDKPWAAIPLKFGDVAVGKLTSARMGRRCCRGPARDRTRCCCRRWVNTRSGWN